MIIKILILWNHRSSIILITSFLEVLFSTVGIGIGGLLIKLGDVLLRTVYCVRR